MPKGATYPKVGDFIPCPQCGHYGADHRGGVVDYTRCGRCACSLTKMRQISVGTINSSGTLVSVG